MKLEQLPTKIDIFSDDQILAAWFGGILEVGATATIGVSEYFDKKSEVFRTKTLPYIEMHSHDRTMLSKLHETYGGQLKPRFWGKGGYIAAEIVAATLPSTVARTEHALAMQNWLNAEHLDEKIAIARDLKGRSWQQDSEPESYASMLKNPAFVAGVFDSRGYMGIRTARTHSTSEDHAQYVHVGSKNIGLLEALRAHFGGRVRVTSPAGSVTEYRERVIETYVDTTAWEVLSSEAINFLRFAYPYLQTTLPEDWELQKSVEKRKMSQQLAERLAEQVRRELAQLEANAIDALSTDAMLADSFGVHKATVGRYLRRMLTREEKKTRFSTLIASSKSTVDSADIRKMIADIEEEVTAFQQGRIDKLSLREDWTERFGITASILDSRVLPRLDPQLSPIRRAALRSQITAERNRNYRASN